MESTQLDLAESPPVTGKNPPTVAIEEATSGDQDRSVTTSDSKDASDNAQSNNNSKTSNPEGKLAEDLTSRLIQGFIVDISSRVKAVEESVKTSQNTRQGLDTASSIKGELEAAVGSKPTVRYCNWEKFKNWFSHGDVRSAMDVLVVRNGEDLEVDMEREQIGRLPSDTRPEQREAYDKEHIRRGHPLNEPKEEAPHLERVRIKSPQVLEFIARVTGQTSLTARPHTFLRPFKFLIHNHQKLENEFRILGEGLKGPKQPIPHESAANVKAPDARPADEVKKANNASKGEGEIKFSGPEGKTPEELYYDHVKCYIEFARAHLVPGYHRFEKLDHVGSPKIRYEDLFSLFRPGELVFERGDSKQESESANSIPEIVRSSSQNQIGPMVWRVTQLSTEGVNWVVRNLYRPSDLRGRVTKTLNLLPIFITQYRLDYDGEEFLPTIKTVRLDRWEGEKAITALPMFPVRFHEDHRALLDEYRTRGEAFQKLLLKGHRAIEYDGWTLSKDPMGHQILDDNGDEQPPVYVSSDVIIDHKEALQSNHWWAPRFWQGKISPKPEAFPLTTAHDYFLNLVWSDAQKTKLLGHMPEMVVLFESIELEREGLLALTDDFLADPATRAFEKNTPKKKLSADDLTLLPNRLFAYSLRDRKFINANIQCLKEITTMADPWEELKIPEHHKDLIRSTVEDHFTKKRLQRELHGMGLESLEQDFIRSKGRGLVFLLHGPPGVGKTATAEAVAFAHQRPLFSLACYDLGVEASTVEYRLSEVFRLANIWDCVLLLDEAEIFLSRREKKDDNLQRNAIVSIFLRTMEYYPGILFLTTNRPGALDEALSSRVHLSLAFRELDLDQTLEIFQMNMRRCEKIAQQRASIAGEPRLVIKEREIADFALNEFKKCEPTPFWNGRVIRNSFQIAMSLAYVDRAKAPIEESERAAGVEGAAAAPAVKYLGRDHFRRVLQIFNDFKNYRQIMFNKSDDKLAYERGERASTRSLAAGNNTLSQDASRGNRYSTPSNQPRPRPGLYQDEPDSWSRDVPEDRGLRRRYGQDQDHDDYDRPRDSRRRPDQEYDSRYAPPMPRGHERPRDWDHDRDHGRDRDRDNQPRQRQGYDRSNPRPRNDHDGLEIPRDRRSQTGRSSQRSRTPSPSPDPTAERREYGDSQHRRPGYN